MDKYKIINESYNPNHKWINRREFREVLEYLRDKEEKYLSEIIESLNKIHNIDKSDFFWRKSLSVGFRRFVHLTYDAYYQHSKFDPNVYDFDIISKEQYDTPLDFDKFRNFATNTTLGDYQLFSQYVKCFYSDANTQITNRVINLQTEENEVKSTFFSIIKRKIKNVTVDKIIVRFLMYVFKNKNPKVYILNSYFKPSYLKILLWKSLGNIKVLNMSKSISSNGFNIELRDKFIHNIEKKVEDEFDRYFYFALYYNFPLFFIEDFEQHYKYYNSFIENRKKELRYIICEDWISSNHHSFFLAIAKEDFNIKHIYNEHNALFHQVLGTSVDMEIKLTDIYYTLGWDNKSEVVKGASLFDYNHIKEYKKVYDILYISSTTFSKRSEWNASYAFSQDAAHLHIKFSYTFFDGLELETLNKIIYRAYNAPKQWRILNKEHILDEFKKKMFEIDNFKHSSKVMMKKSKLVIIDYIATGYLESLIMNIPTIVFWNQDTYFLNDANLDFFDKLIECGICQTSPESAADFVNELINNNKIEVWWNSKKTQNARKYFLEQNIGNPENAINFYLSLVK